MLLIILGILLLSCVSVLLFVNLHPVFGKSASRDELLAMRSYPNRIGDKFKNLYPTKDTFEWPEYKQMIRKMLRGNPNRLPPADFPIQKWTGEQLDQIDTSKTTAIWYGHSAFFLKMNGQNILLDPMFGDYPSPLPYLVKKRFHDELPTEIEDLPIRVF